MIGITWTREIIPMRHGAIQIMVGRPRKLKARERNGRAQRVYVNPKAQVMAQPHRVGLPKAMRGREEAESPFGRLLLQGQITAAQYEAGKAYAELNHRFRATWGLPPIHPRAIDLLSSGGMVHHEVDVGRCKVIRDRMDAAFIACGSAGRRAQLAVKDHVVFERPVTGALALHALVCGLNALIPFFGIDEFLQIRHVRNTG